MQRAGRPVSAFLFPSQRALGPWVRTRLACPRPAAWGLGAALSLSACAGPGFFTDGTSVSMGASNRGVLRRGHRLPPEGKGYVIPQLWQDRGASYTTDEFAAALQSVARRVSREYPGGTLGIADLSLKGGGDSEHHRSHENGRDADLIYYAVDRDGRPATPVSSMPRYDYRFDARPPHDTQGVAFSDFTPRRFDVRRNWALVRALLTAQDVEIQYLFAHNRLRQAMLDHARSIGDDEGLIDRADAILRQPGDSLPHDDHLHVRIYCDPRDRALGCKDAGPLRWWKKRYKYMPPQTAPERSLDRLLASTYFSRPLP